MFSSTSLSNPTLNTWINSQNSHNTARCYQRAIEDIESVIGKGISSMNTTDVTLWVSDMKYRGLAQSTVNARVSAVSSACHFLEIDDITSHIPRKNPVCTGIALSADEARSLVAAILDDIEIKPVRGYRNLALIAGALMTGREPGVWRNIQWGQITYKDRKTYFRWEWRGKVQIDILPEPIWDAIKNFLHLTGRLENMAYDDPIFTAISDNATRLPNVEVAEHKQSISDREACRVQAFYCRRAGLKPITFRTLRTTAALLRHESGESITQIAQALGLHERDAKRQVLSAKQTMGSSWLSIGEMLGIDQRNISASSPTHRRRIKQ